jgi:hypothetical protein
MKMWHSGAGEREASYLMLVRHPKPVYLLLVTVNTIKLETECLTFSGRFI